MSTKLCYLLIALICGQACQISGRIVRRGAIISSNEQNSSESKENGLGDGSLNPSNVSMVPTKELTDEDIAKMKKDLSKELTPVQLERFGEILLKFKKGSTTKDLVEGMVEILIFAVAVKANATDIEIRQIFEDNPTTTLTPIAENNI